MAVVSVLRRLAWPIAIGTATATVLIGVATAYATTGGPWWWWLVLAALGVVLAVCFWWGFRLQAAASDGPGRPADEPTGGRHQSVSGAGNSAILNADSGSVAAWHIAGDVNMGGGESNPKGRDSSAK